MRPPRSFVAAQAAEAAATSAGGGTGIERGTVSDPSASFSLCNASCMVTVTSSRQSWVPLPSGPRNPSRRSTCSTKCFREGVRFGKPSRLYKNATSMTMGASIRKEAKSLFNVCPTTTVCGVINANMSFWASSRVYSVASKSAAVMPVMCVRKSVTGAAGRTSLSSRVCPRPSTTQTRARAPSSSAVATISQSMASSRSSGSGGKSVCLAGLRLRGAETQPLSGSPPRAS
mmetsp:Transcript_39177/g.110956  ORF Transcript_39177/g.110956 Transcript_39177/m.110956 type:complete len:230 (+) Transcript_39177:374-1063(+)